MAPHCKSALQVSRIYFYGGCIEQGMEDKFVEWWQEKELLQEEMKWRVIFVEIFEEEI